MIFRKDGDKLLAALASKTNMDMDKVISAYLILGDDLFLLLRIFEGQTFSLPSKRRLGCMNLHNIYFIEDDERKYADYERKQIIETDGKEYCVAGKEKKFLNHYYIPVTLLEDKGAEDEEGRG